MSVKSVEVVHVLNMVKTVYTPTRLSQLEVKSGNYCYSPRVFHAILDIKTKLEFHGSVQCECLHYSWFSLHSQTNNIPLSYPLAHTTNDWGLYGSSVGLFIMHEP